MQIKKILSLLVILFFTHLTLYAEGFDKSASNEPVLVQKGSSKHWCPLCGMDLKMFYKTNHTSKLPHGEDRQYCSVRCLVVDMQEYSIKKEDVKVVDAKTEKLINASTAFYVLGSDVKGTMSPLSKLAFASKEDALAFIKEHNGKIVDFDTVLKSAKESLKSDTAMIDEKKKKKVYPMGKKIFEEMCKGDIDLNKYLEINGLKASLVNDKLCKPLQEQQLQAVALYLWEVKRVGDYEAVVGKIEVKKDEKCPVCGMFVYKYPKWAAQIYYQTKGAGHHHSFDGVKDLMKFYFNPISWGNYKTSTHENISKILVTDYYSQKAIDAKVAYYVLGSDVYGPMGDELIPFLNESDAKTFLQDHKGKKILQFKNITKSDISTLDE